MNSDHLIGPVKYKRRYGFIDHSGAFVIEPVFESLGPFAEGLAAFRKEGKYGFIDYRGEIAIPPVHETDRLAGPIFSDRLAAVGQYGEVGYINPLGEFDIPKKFGVGRDFFQNLTVVDFATSPVEHAVINRDGDVVSRLDVYEVPYVSGWPSSWDLFGCFVVVNHELLTAFLNWKGEVIFPAKYPLMTEFCEGVAGFTENNEEGYNIYGLVSLSGEILHRPSFYRMGPFAEGLAPAGRGPKQFGFINPVGEWVIEPKFRQAQCFSEGLACVTVHDNTRRGKKGFINRSGEMVIEPRFHREASFYNGFAQVEYEGKHAVIDKTGRVIWETEIDSD